MGMGAYSLHRFFLNGEVQCTVKAQGTKNTQSILLHSFGSLSDTAYGFFGDVCLSMVRVMKAPLRMPGDGIHCEIPPL